MGLKVKGKELLYNKVKASVDRLYLAGTSATGSFNDYVKNAGDTNVSYLKTPPAAWSIINEELKGQLLNLTSGNVFNITPAPAGPGVGLTTITGVIVTDDAGTPNQWFTGNFTDTEGDPVSFPFYSSGQVTVNVANLILT